MIKKLILVGFVLSLAGCAPTVPKEIDIPIAVKQPAPKIPAKLILPISRLTKDSNSKMVMKSYIVTVNLLINDDNNLRAILKAYS